MLIGTSPWVVVHFSSSFVGLALQGVGHPPLCRHSAYTVGPTVWKTATSVFAAAFFERTVLFTMCLLVGLLLGWFYHLVEVLLACSCECPLCLVRGRVGSVLESTASSMENCSHEKPCMFFVGKQHPYTRHVFVWLWVQRFRDCHVGWFLPSCLIATLLIVLQRVQSIFVIRCRQHTVGGSSIRMCPEIQANGNVFGWALKRFDSVAGKRVHVHDETVREPSWAKRNDCAAKCREMMRSRGDPHCDAIDVGDKVDITSHIVLCVCFLKPWFLK